MSNTSDNEDANWAAEVLASVGFLWSSDLADKIAPAVEKRLSELFPTESRWWWHLTSFALFIGSLLAGQNPDAAPVSLILALLLLGSLTGHGYFAFQSWKVKTAAKGKKSETLYDLLAIELQSRRTNHLVDGPFGPMGPLPPAPRPRGVNHEEAEHLAAQWLAYLGEDNVLVTRAKNDGGIDVVSSRCVAQVKNYQGSVGVPEIRELVGAASVDGRFPVFFTSGVYTKAAVEFANQANVHLFIYDAVSGTLDGANAPAQKFLRDENSPDGNEPSTRSPFLGIQTLGEIADRTAVIELFLEWAPSDPARGYISGPEKDWAKAISAIAQLGGLNLEASASQRPEEQLTNFEPIWAEFESAAASFAASLGVELPVGKDFSAAKWSKALETEMSSDGSGRLIQGKPAWDLIPAVDKAAWWLNARSSLRLAMWFSQTAEEVNDAFVSTGKNGNLFWDALSELKPEIERWIGDAEKGTADLNLGLLLKAKIKGLIGAWAESVGIDASELFATERRPFESHPSKLGNRKPPEENRVAPPHCPRCDYAPASEEKTCLECGLGFSQS